MQFKDDAEFCEVRRVLMEAQELFPSEIYAPGNTYDIHLNHAFKTSVHAHREEARIFIEDQEKALFPGLIDNMVDLEEAARLVNENLN